MENIQSASAISNLRLRIGALDAFRGIAILAVIGYHYTFEFGPHLPWFQYGFLGVEFFFIISGFVIFMTLEKCRSVADFATRRFSRLYPAFVFCLTLTFLVAPRGATISDYLANLTMAAPHFGFRWVDTVYWSLLVELKFYFWVAAIYFFLGRHFIAKWILFCLASTQFHHLSDTLDWLVPNQMMPFFLSGMAFYLWYRDRRIALSAAALFVAAAVLYVGYWRDSGWPVHVIVATMVIVFLIFVTGRMSDRKMTWLSYIGTVSYPLYLFHRNIGVSIVDLGGPWWPLIVPSVAIVAVGIASIVHICIEKPSQIFIRRVVLPSAPPAELSLTTHKSES